MRNDCGYARMFEPSISAVLPSGLKQPPRPFVFRASHLDGRTFGPGERFYFDLHVFEMRYPALPYFVQTFEEAAREGFGTGRGRVGLEAVCRLDSNGEPAAIAHRDAIPEPIVICLCPDAVPVRRARIRFVTPTELKSSQALTATPEFATLFGRARDRVSTLRALYGEGPLPIDFKHMGERARGVRMTRCDLRQVDVNRRSSRTAQTHSIGGFVGEAEYAGELAEFIPLLRAARWTGVGRHTVWGKGELHVVTDD
jgi:hypothetical protein